LCEMNGATLNGIVSTVPSLKRDFFRPEVSAVGRSL
jgi:hypothetical protein